MVQGVLVENGHIVDTDPATGKEIARVPVTTPQALDAVITRAREAQVGWAARTLEERGELLKSACRTLGERKEELARTIVQEMGKVLSEAEEEVEGAIGKDAFIDLVLEANRPVSLEGGKSVVVRQAHGVVAICSPWNFPADEILLLAIPALAAGNAVVVKPSEVAPLTGAIVLDALMKVLPAGVANLVQGDGSVGGPLVQHAGVDMVAMTGSSPTGKKIMEACSHSLKRLVLELGGKDPMVVFADADLERAAEDAVTYSLKNCGQVCCAIERIYVDKAIKDVFEKKVTEKAMAWKAGNGLEAGAKVGPMVSQAQKEIVGRHVDDALAHGARLLHKGDVPEAGNFYPVTVLTDLQQDMVIQQEETFGPVVAIAGFDGSEEEAVRLSNDTQFGLTACVYSGDIGKASRVARRIRAGQVGVNTYPLASAALNCPWVGHKGSGFGYHSGPDGWRQFSLPQSIVRSEPMAQAEPAGP